MAGKMYYTAEEAAEKLGCSVENLDKYVSEQKIRVFKDGLRNVYTAAEVDSLAQELGTGVQEAEVEEIKLAPAEPETPREQAQPERPEVDITSADEEIELTPADTEKSEVSLSEMAEEPEKPSEKEETVISSEGASIFDQADFEVEGVDQMAKTQVAPSLDEQIAMEGVGSGSGLLDLTRESDDTSLGAEILEHIDADGTEAPPVEEIIGEEGILEEAAAETAPAPAAEPTYVEAEDPVAALFGGMTVGTSAVVLVVAGVALAAMLGYQPSYLEWLGDNVPVTILISVLVIGFSALIGFLVGKSAAQKQAAIRRAGG